MRAPADLNYPSQYHYRHKRESDRDWILSMLSFIPLDLQPGICREYERLYGKDKDGRRNANSYLKSRAAEHRAKNAS